MTSGSFHSVEINKITVNREERQRRDVSDVSDLSDSINRIGLINPITINREYVLVAGERRLKACQSIGWTHIHCHFTDELEPSALRSIELEENIKRAALPWQDECRAVREFHQLQRAREPDWTIEKTAEAIGFKSAAPVNERLMVAEELEKGNVLVTEAPRFSTARGIIERANSRKSQETILALRSPTVGRDGVVAEPDSILQADFCEWAKTYTGPKFNFIHCDFPYGIGADKFNQGAAPTHGGYDDSEDTYWRLCRSLVDCLDSVAAESCHFMFWFSMHFYQDTLNFFHTNSNVRLDPFPLVWVKSDNIGILPDPQRGPRRIYETAFFGSRGDRKIVRSKSNACYLPSVRDSHMSIKPEAMLRHFFEMFVDSSTKFLDPTCGSGSSLRAAERLGAAHTLGLELNPDFADRAKLALKSFRLEKAHAKVESS